MSANVVWRRFCESYGLIRTSRCTPRSARSQPYARRPSTSKVTLFRPVCSPSVWSRTSVENRCRSAQRRNMRSSISAQSVASVPPAPALIVTSAPRWSYSPEKRRAVRSRSNVTRSVSASRSISASISASSASAAMSASSSSPVARDSMSCQVASSVWRPSASRRIRWAARWSSQNPGTPISALSSATRASFAGRSKTPRGRVDPPGKLAQAGPVHQALPRTSCRRIGRSSMSRRAVLLRATTGFTHAQ